MYEVNTSLQRKVYKTLHTSKQGKENKHSDAVKNQWQFGIHIR
jgi:hypothetical protein